MALPTVSYRAVGGIRLTEAELRGNITAFEGIEIVEDGRPELVINYGFQWGTTTSYANETSVLTHEEGSEFPVETYIVSLTPSTLYHYRLWAENVHGRTNGTDQQFTTSGSGSFQSLSLLL